MSDTQVHANRRCRAIPEFDAKRFWARVTKTRGCWLFNGQLERGMFTILGETFLAHRIAWTLIRGCIPPGILVCHHCDTPGCVRPKHLFLGTDSDNMLDKKKKGRSILVPRGEENGRAKLTAQKVRSIRRKHATGKFSFAALARTFGISAWHASLLVRRENWKHIT